MEEIGRAEEDLFELGQHSEEIDAEARRRLEDEIVRRFAASPEAKALMDIHSRHFVMDFAADYFNGGSRGGLRHGARGHAPAKPPGA